MPAGLGRRGTGLFSGMVGFVSGRVIGFGLDLADLAGHGCGLQARLAGGQLRVLGGVEDSSVSIFVSASHSWMGPGICHATRRWWPTWSAGTSRTSIGNMCTVSSCACRSPPPWWREERPGAWGSRARSLVGMVPVPVRDLHDLIQNDAPGSISTLTCQALAYLLVISKA